MHILFKYKSQHWSLYISKVSGRVEDKADFDFFVNHIFGFMIFLQGT